jgi:3',5'-nucleoside bisphosphate phosphatase
MARADFHTHSTASDGLLSPDELVNLASDRGISFLSLTDHDTTDNVLATRAAAGQAGITFVTGVELSTHVRRGELHMLGYGIDIHDSDLQAELGRLRASRRERAGKMVERLNAIGIDITSDDVAVHAGGDSVGRPHVARAMIDKGYVTSIDEAFNRYIGPGREAYVPRRALMPEQAVELIRAAGGVPVLAHPFTLPDYAERLPDLIAAGLQGIEVYYGEYSAADQKRLATVARHHGLLATGGSDYHGPNFREGRELGSVAIPETAIQALLSAISYGK